VPRRAPGIVGANISRLLSEKGLGDTALSKLAGVPRSTITSLIRGDVQVPSTETVQKLATGFGVPESELLRRQISEAEFDAMIVEFKASAWAQTLEPPFGDDDLRFIRGPGRWTISGEKPAPKALYHLVMAGRALAAGKRSDD
jgi:transcriptional regulator with XRE-family HTH domain